MPQVIRASETVEAQIGPNIKDSSLIGFDHQAAGMIFIPGGFPHQQLQIHASDAAGGEFYPITGGTLDVAENTAVPLPPAVIGARHLKITGDAEETTVVQISRKS